MCVLTVHKEVNGRKTKYSNIVSNLVNFKVFFTTASVLKEVTGFKGTVRPDWICMRVVPLESPIKGH